MTLRIICFFVLIDVILGVKLLNCPKQDLKFEKILGLRPPETYHPLLLYKNDAGNVPVTEQCIAKCSSNSDCRSFVLFYNTSTCYWYNTTIEGSQELENIVDIEVSWFSKTCLNAENCSKLWIFDRVPGAILISNDTKILPGVLTRADCQQYCLNETEFTCRAVKFKIQENHPEETKGLCVLSDANRQIQSSSYRVSSYDDEYFENLCAPYSENHSDFCAYEEYENSTLAHSDVFYERKTKESCQQLCDSTKNFNCKGFSLVYVNHQNSLCYLHSEDSKVFGPKLLRPNRFGMYYEKAQCLKMSITCTEAYMTVDYAPEKKFNGRMYMQGYSEDPQCFVEGSGFNPIKLKLPLLSDNCGIIKAMGPNDRTLMSGTMILQYNPLVQTQGDRLFRIGCIFGNDSKLVVGTGLTITSTAGNKGSMLINSSSTTPAPTVEMRVVDLQTQAEVSETQIGQELQLTIEIKPPDSFDIWASHLIAMTEKSDESILLVDDRGCPTNIHIFPGFSRIFTNDTRKLVASFQAFKFTSSPVVRFSVIVQFCSRTCPNIQCSNDLESHDRLRRRIVTKSIETVNGTKIIPVDRSQFDNQYKGSEMPLEIIMVVKGPTSIADRLIVGNHKILVAGYDYATDEVCLNYSLFVGVIVIWVLIQIIFVVFCVMLIRRYKKHYEYEATRQSLEELHKNFGIGFSNLENRRVHWADNGTDLT